MLQVLMRPMLRECTCRWLKDRLVWMRPVPVRLHTFVINRLLHLDPYQRPTPEEAVREFDGLLECLKPYVDAQGYLKAPHTLASLTAMYPPAPMLDAAMVGMQLEGQQA